MNYLDAVNEGKNEWWRYLAALFVIMTLWLVVGSMPYLALNVIVSLDTDPATSIDPNTGAMTGVNPLWPFLALMISFVALLFGLYVAVRYVHGRRFLGLITPATINWRRAGEGLAVWFLLAAVLAVFEALLHPSRYQLTFEPIQFILFTVAAIALIPIQTTAEELVFRGYLLQSLSLLTRNRIFLCLLSGLLFLGPHFANPEVSQSLLLLPLFYFAFGVFLAHISLKENSLELALGVHAANNLFAAIFANYKGSALPTPSLFTAVEFDPLYNVFGAIVAMVVFYFWFYWPGKKTAE
ncbi:MAG: CPBP family intramembrane metalloprotease [Chloroflexi bacterium]|nr:CPBP family intramembrane metalloprotease [Chloroflexota bacterium]